MAKKLYKSDVTRPSKLVESLNEFNLYFLIDGELIVFIDYSQQFGEKIIEHLKSKKFDKFHVIPVSSESEAIECKIQYIKDFAPVYNSISYEPEKEVVKGEKESPFEKPSEPQLAKPGIVPMNVFRETSRLRGNVPSGGFIRKMIDGVKYYLMNVGKGLVVGAEVGHELYSYNDKIYKPSQAQSLFVGSVDEIIVK